MSQSVSFAQGGSFSETNHEIDRLRFALEASGVGTWDFEFTSNFIVWDENCQTLFGAKGIIDPPYQIAFDIIHPDDRKSVEDALKVALDPAVRRPCDLRFRTIGKSDKILRWLQCRGQAYFDENKRAVRLSGIVMDVSAEAEAEERAKAAQLPTDIANIGSKAAEDRFKILIDHAPVAMMVVGGDDMVFETVNKPMLDIFNKTEVVIGRPLLEALPELEGQKLMDLLYEVYQTGKSRTGDDIPLVLYRNGERETRYFTFSLTPLKTTDNVTGVILVATEITKQVKDRELLKESEQRFRSLIEQAPVATCLFVGSDMRIEVANKIMLNVWGKSNEVIGKPLHVAVPELIGQPFLDILDQVYKTGNTYSALGAPADLMQDGELRTFYFDFFYKPLRNANGSIYGIMDMAVDVTQQVLARQKLEESELFTRSVFDNSPVAKLVFVGKDMIVKSINQNMLQMLGRDENVIGTPFFQLIPELAKTDLPGILQEVFRTGETHYRNEQKFEINRFGKKHVGYYNYIYKALSNPSGEIYGIIVTATEVSEHVMAREKILEAEETFRQAVELADLGTWSLDVNTATMEFNARLRKWFGFNEHEKISVEAAFQRIEPEDLDKVQVSMVRAIDPDLRSDYDVEYRVYEPQTGNERILHAQGKAFFTEDGKPYRVSGTAQDVTSQRKVQLALEQEVKERTTELNQLNEELIETNEELYLSNERLMHSNEELAQYAYVASHDLQEPLRKIRLFSDMLNGEIGTTDQGKHFISKIMQSSERMTMLIRDLLEFSRLLKSDRLMRPVNLELVAEAVVNDFELTISEKGARVTIGKLPEVEAVNLQMNQLFYNLLGNALKFIATGKTPEININASEITFSEAEKFVGKVLPFATYYRITFSDNGIGFDPEYAEQIFEVFKRLHGRDMYPGSGIGLALCRRIVANHQGYLYADSVPGEGTTFHIILPTKQQDVQSTLPKDFTWPGK